MPITEAARHHLITQLEHTIGTEAAMTLADHLPPVGWADVATTRDLDHLRTQLEGRLESSLHRERAEMLRHLEAMQRNLFFAVLAAFTANTGIVVAVLTST